MMDEYGLTWFLYGTEEVVQGVNDVSFCKFLESLS